MNTYSNFVVEAAEKARTLYNQNKLDEAMLWASVVVNQVFLDTRESTASMTDKSQPNPSSIALAVDEILAEESVSGDLGAGDEALLVQTPDEQTDLARLVKVVKSGDFVILDTETTGLYGGAEICQIAIIDSAGNTLLDTLVKPQRAIPSDATRIHGIDNVMVSTAPTWQEINERVWSLLREKTVIVYNAEYDFKMLAQSEAACNPLAVSDWHTIKRECAMLAYAEYRGVWNDYHSNWKWHKLTEAADRVGYRLPAGQKAHSALADCLMTLAVCHKLAGL